MTTVLLTGATLAEARALRDVDVAAALDGLPSNKVHCSVLAEDVIREALDAYDAGVPSR
jgi:nitrogen fixation NifU-like protein